MEGEVYRSSLSVNMRLEIKNETLFRVRQREFISLRSHAFHLK